MKPISLFTIFLLVTGSVKSQKAWVVGYLRDSITHYPIAKGTINNASNNKKAQTDSRGLFKIKLAPDDVLYVTADAYHYDTVRYSLLFGDTMSIYLVPIGNILPTVTVQSQYNKYQVDSITRKTTFDQMKGTTNSTISGNPNGFGIAINLDRYTKKKYQKIKKQEELFQKTEEETYIDYRFSPQMVASNTGLKGDDLKAFMYRYRPDYKWLREHTSNEEMLYYINDKLLQFRQNAQSDQKNQ